MLLSGLCLAAPLAGAAPDAGPAEVETADAGPEAAAHGTPVVTTYAQRLREVEAGCDQALAEKLKLYDALDALTDEAPILDVLQLLNQLAWNGNEVLGLSHVYQSVAADERMAAAGTYCRSRLLNLRPGRLKADTDLNRLTVARPGYEALDDQAWRYFELMIEAERSQFDTWQPGIEAASAALSIEVEETYFHFLEHGIAPTGELVVDQGRLAGVSPYWLHSNFDSHGAMVTIPLGTAITRALLPVVEDETVRAAIWAGERVSPPSDDLATLARTLSIRAAEARLYGRPSHAHRMARAGLLGEPEEVARFLETARQALRPLVEANLAALLAYKRTLRPGAVRVEPWDERWLLARWRQTVEAALGSAGLQCLSLGEVAAVVFDLYATRLGVRFEDAPPQPMWDFAIKIWEVRRGERRLGQLYVDPWARPGKRGGGVMIPLHAGRLGLGPVPATLGAVALLTSFGQWLHAGEVNTLVHETAHAVHHLLAQSAPWWGQTGVAYPVDFNEVPSQLFELWLEEPEVQAKLTICSPEETTRLWQHYHAVMAMSRPLQTWNLLRRAALGLHLHTLDLAPEPVTVEALTEAWQVIHRRYDLFGHDTLPGLFAEDISDLIIHDMRIYKYPWGQMVAHDLRARLAELEAIDPEAARALLVDEVLAPGAGITLQSLTDRFLGRPLDQGPWLRWLAKGPSQAQAMVSLMRLHASALAALGR